MSKSLKSQNKWGRIGIISNVIDEKENDNLSELLPKIGNYKIIERNCELYSPDNCPEYVFQVLQGAVRTVSYFEDGRRQVGAFYFPGEFFGFDVSVGSFSAEAVVDTEFAFLRRAQVMELAPTYPALTDELLVRTIEALHRTEVHILLLGRQTAEERLENFLVDMACRIGNGNSVDLPMDRRDIADYLALAIETVSRTFAALERKKRIKTPSCRRILLTGSLEDPLSSPGAYAEAHPSTADSQLAIRRLSSAPLRPS